jgi:hypothetical protein
MPSAKPMPRRKAPKKPPEADDLVRETAGNYVSGDDRFEVRQSDSTWYLVDREQTNEFGQELIHGSFGSLKAARAAMPGARDIKPLLRSRTRRRARPATKKKSAAPPPPTWIDRLPADQAADIRRTIRALEKEGIDDAEALTKRDREGLLPAIASRLLTRRIDGLIEDLPDDEQAIARQLVDRLGEAISASDAPGALPGWALFETGLSREPKRRLRLGD